MGSVEKALNKHFAIRLFAAKAAGRRSRLADLNKLKDQMKQFLSLVIAPQIQKDFRLDLNDEMISRELGVSERRAKQIRLELKAAGIIDFPEWSRPKKKGDYPYWMVVRSFIQFPIKKRRTFVPKTSKKYNQIWCRIYDQAKKVVFADLELYSMRVTVQQFMVMVYQTINKHIARMGLTKESFLL
jgi:hypothetical protein